MMGRLTEEKPPMSSSKVLQLEVSALGGSTGAHPFAVELSSGDAQLGGQSPPRKKKMICYSGGENRNYLKEVIDCSREKSRGSRLRR